MKDDILLNHDKLFDRYFQEALAIRAICDDLEFPPEYSPIFVNIHVRGIEHFDVNDEDRKKFKQVFDLFDPMVQDKLDRQLEKMNSEESKDMLSNLCPGGQIKDMDNYLAETENVNGFLRNQLENLKRMYFEEDYCAHMVALYTFYIKPFIESYDEVKIQKAFHKGRIRDMVKKLKQKKYDDYGEHSA